jgi:phytoene desaturase
VRLASGDTLQADIVVSNADAAWTYRHLLPESARKRWSNRRIERARYSNGLFVWYFGTRKQYPDVPHHTILMGPRYRELLDDIFQHQTLAEDFSLYLHRPTATDPSMAPQGCDSFYVLAPVPHLEADIDWSEQAEPYRRAIARYLEATVLPGLEETVISSRVTTPQDFETRLLSFRGAGFSFEPTLMQSAWFRPHNASEDIDAFYLVGAETHPGAGLPGVLSSARVLDQVVPHAHALA